MASSFVVYAGDGTNKTFAVPFGYLSQSHVGVLVNGASVPFTWINAGVVQTSAAPASGATVLVKRTTPQIPIVSFVDGSTLVGSDLNTSELQALYIAQEAYDMVAFTIGLSDSTGQFDAQNKRITNLAAPSSGADAATKDYADQTVSAAASSAAAAAASAASAQTYSAQSASDRAAAAGYAAQAATSAAAAATVDPTNYYTKAAVDVALAGKANVADLFSKADASAVSAALAAKADTASLGSAATKNVGTAAYNVVQLDANAKLPVGLTALSNAWESSAQIYTVGGTLTLAHSLGKMPTLVQAWLKCVTAEQGYAAGDMYPLGVIYSVSGTFIGGVLLVPSATEIFVRFPGASYSIAAMNKSTGAYVGLTAANWNLIVRAYA